MGRQAYGVIGIRLDEGDYVVAMIASTSEDDMVLSVTEGGFGKRTNVEEYRTQGRGGKGIINVQTTDKNGKVVAIMPRSGRFRRSRHDGEWQTDPRALHGYSRRRPRHPGRSTDQLDDDDKVTAATLIEGEGENGNDAEAPPTIN